MDTMDVFEHRGWRFLCSAEQLPDGAFHAVVRYRAPPSDEVRTLAFDNVGYPTAAEALLAARAMAVRWSEERDGDGRGSD